MYGKQLLGAEPVCCFCQVTDKHLLIAHQKDPDKILYKVHLLEIALKLCNVRLPCVACLSPPPPRPPRMRIF
jgi:hypothetical protein